MIELNGTELRMIPGDEIALPLTISGWNFEDGDIPMELDNQLKKFLLDFVRNASWKNDEL